MYWFILYKPCTNVPFKSLCHVDLPSGKRHPTTTPLQISRRIDGRNTTHSQVKGLVRGNPLGDTNKSLGNKQTTHFQRDFHHPLPGSAKNSMVYLIVGRCLYFCFLCVCVCVFGAAFNDIIAKHEQHHANIFASFVHSLHGMFTTNIVCIVVSRIAVYSFHNYQSIMQITCANMWTTL